MHGHRRKPLTRDSRGWCRGRHLIAEAAQLMNQSGGTLCRAPWISRVSEFDVWLPSVEDDPDDPAQSMGNRPDGLVMPQSRHPPLVQRLKDAALGLAG